MFNYNSWYNLGIKFFFPIWNYLPLYACMYLQLLKRKCFQFQIVADLAAVWMQAVWCHFVMIGFKRWNYFYILPNVFINLL